MERTTFYGWLRSCPLPFGRLPLIFLSSSFSSLSSTYCIAFCLATPLLLLFNFGRLFVCFFTCMRVRSRLQWTPTLFNFFLPLIKVRRIFRLEESLKHLSDWLVKACGTRDGNTGSCTISR